MSGKFKVRIDRDQCIMCGACWTACPDFFEESTDDWLSQVVEKYRVGGNIGEGEAPEEMEDCVKDAADQCPVEIIHVEEKPR